MTPGFGPLLYFGSVDNALHTCKGQAYIMTCTSNVQSFILILLPLDETLLAEKNISANWQSKLAYHALIQHRLGRLKDGRFVEIFCSLMGGRFDIQNSWQRLESIVKSLLRCQSE